MNPLEAFAFGRRIDVYPQFLTIPTKVYVHKQNLEVFGDIHHAIGIAGCYLSNRNNWPIDPATPLYLIATAWANEGTRNLDVYAFSDIRDKTGNPSVDMWTIKNGWLEETSQLACGRNLILLGKEEEMRLSSKSLEHYLKQLVPDIFT